MLSNCMWLIIILHLKHLCKKEMSKTYKITRTHPIKKLSENKIYISNMQEKN